MRVGEAGVARANGNLDAARGVGENLCPGDLAGLGKVALLADRELGIAGEAGDPGLPDRVLHALVDVEADIHASVVAHLANGARDLCVEVAAVAKDFLDLGQTLRLLLGRDGRVGEPPEGVPPRQHVDRLEELVGGDPRGAREHIGTDLLA